MYAQLVGGSTIYVPEVDDEVAAAVRELHDTDDTVFGDPDASVALPVAGGLRVTLRAADLARVDVGASVPF